VKQNWKMFLAVGIVALVAGIVGAGIFRVAFPPAAGPVGVTGPAGPAGPAGNPAPAAIVDTNKLGYCYDYNTNTSNDGSTTWMTWADISAPTDNNGTLSCYSGTFVSLTPVMPNGNPVKNYDATRPN